MGVSSRSQQELKFWLLLAEMETIIYIPLLGKLLPKKILTIGNGFLSN
jgi:hypothetical protein